MQCYHSERFEYGVITTKKGIIVDIHRNNVYIISWCVSVPIHLVDWLGSGLLFFIYVNRICCSAAVYVNTTKMTQSRTRKVGPIR